MEEDQEKCKLKPQCDTTSLQLEWLSSINQQITSAGEDVENPFALLVGMQTGAATVESSMKIPQKIRNGTAL